MSIAGHEAGDFVSAILRAMNDPVTNPSRAARVLEWRWLAVWFVLLLPLAVLFPPIPIDETRYLTAAWEMFNSGQWLVPTVNGAWYSDKSPLLFWLITGGWEIVGVHTWVARVEALIVALGMLLALRRLAARLGMEARGANNAMWLLAGCLGFSVFSTAIMFDLLLALCVLGALHALLDLDAGKWTRGIVALGVTIGLGILAKGPVVLLHVAAISILAPLWSDTARRHKARWYLALPAGLLIGIAIALCWLLPAALYAGPTYWQPLLDKVSGRIAHSFAHNRPWWWYLPLVPVLLLPWLLTLRAPATAWKNLWRGRFGRFLWCWWVVPFVAFCAISGKQIHYVLPLLPAWALAGAWLLQQSGARLRALLFGLLALLAAIGMAALPWQAAKTFGYPVRPAIAVFALVGLIVAAGVWRLWGRDARALALSATALVSAAMLAGALAYLPALDVRPEAAFVKQALAEHVAIAHVEWHNGLFGYTGRLRQPLPWIPHDRVQAWCRAHPDGILLTSDRSAEPGGAQPFRTWPYFLSGDHRIAAWRASQVLATGHH
jgi:4-amino-4-deoxy-L-arabinose transferase-like glycosyltransferase